MKKTRGPNKPWRVKESERARELTDNFVQKIIEYRDKKTKELIPIEGIDKYIMDYGRAIFELKDPEFSYALIYLRKTIAETGNEALVTKGSNENFDVRQDIKLLIAKGVLTSSPLAAVHHKDILVQALSGPLDLRIKYGLSFQVY